MTVGKVWTILTSLVAVFVAVRLMISAYGGWQMSAESTQWYLGGVYMLIAIVVAGEIGRSDD